MRSLMRSPSIGFAGAVFGIALCFGQSAQHNQTEPANFYQVYQYGTPAMGRLYPTFWTTYVANGDGANEHHGQGAAGLAAWSMELDYGVTDRLSLATYFDVQALHGSGPQFTGGQIESQYRFRNPYDLPVNLAVSGKDYIPFKSYNRSQELELRLIVEKDHQNFRFDLNPKVNISTTGPRAGSGPRLGFDAAVAWRRFFRAQPGLEYYSNYGAISHSTGGKDIEQLLFPTIDFRLGHNLDWRVGAGIGLNADASDLILVRSSLTYEFQGISSRRLLSSQNQ
jgi:hypothetical protein